jgi:hypothetical protein
MADSRSVHIFRLYVRVQAFWTRVCIDLLGDASYTAQTAEISVSDTHISKYGFCAAGSAHYASILTLLRESQMGLTMLVH